MQPSIEYSIRSIATFHFPGQRNNFDVSSSRKLKLIPFTQVGPPLEQEDFPGEFKASATAMLRTRPLASSCGVVSISMREPEPLRMLNNSISSCGKSWIKFAFRPLCDNQSCPKRWTCKLDSQIQIKTFYSTVPMCEMASCDLLKRNSHTRLRSSYTCEKTRRVDLLLQEQEEASPEKRSEHGGTRTYSATMLWPIGQANLLPTFCSPLAARRYSLQIRVRIEGFSHHQLSLEAPLQVHYCNPIHCVTHGKCQDFAGPYGYTTPPSPFPAFNPEESQFEVNAINFMTCIAILFLTMTRYSPSTMAFEEAVSLSTNNYLGYESLRARDLRLSRGGSRGIRGTGVD